MKRAIFLTITFMQCYYSRSQKTHNTPRMSMIAVFYCSGWLVSLTTGLGIFKMLDGVGGGGGGPLH